MFTIPATVLGTKQDVVVLENVNNSMFGVARFSGQPAVNAGSAMTVQQLQSWAMTLSLSQASHLVELHFPSAQYSALETSWALYTFGPGWVATPPTSQTPASAFQVGDWVIWNPQTINLLPTHSLVAGGNYYIVSCVFQGPPACWGLANTHGGPLVDVADEDEITMVPVTGTQLSLPLAPKLHVIYVDDLPPLKKCECGAAKCGHPFHSTWCQMYTP